VKHAPALPSLAERRQPALSETLRGPRHPGRCQACGAEPDDRLELQRWRECDAWDKPTSVVVILCRACSRRLIAEHPRLYVAVDALAPAPGLMALCVGCRRRDGVSCTSPLLKANGGPGMVITFPKPDAVHLCFGGGHGEFRQLYRGAPSACMGREVAS
jgi:hypothetical protein